MAQQGGPSSDGVSTTAGSIEDWTSCSEKEASVLHACGAQDPDAVSPQGQAQAKMMKDWRTASE
eukprot:2836554-Amphidinium_carterae.1